LWSYNGPAILSAVRDGGKSNQVKIVCFDDDQDTLAGIKSGEIYATVVQQPFEFGYQSMMMMAKLVGGDKSAVPDDKHHYIETIALKKGDVDQYQANLKKILGN
jgi:ribose transport system substrate-binding protein